MQPIILATSTPSTTSTANKPIRKGIILNNLYHHYETDSDVNNKTENCLSETLDSEKILTKNNNNNTKLLKNSDKLKRVSSDISNSKSLSLKYTSKLRKNSSDYAIIANAGSDLKTSISLTDNSPLLVIGTQPAAAIDSTNSKQKFFNLKKNGASLIFQKKSQAVRYCKTSNSDLEDAKNRRSLQWSGRTEPDDKTVVIKQRHSWYDPSYPDIKEEVSVDYQENNLAGTNNIIGTPAESESLIDRNRISEAGVGGSEDPNPPRRKRIEQFLKNLVGKKPSREPVIVPVSHDSQPTPAVYEKVNKYPSEHNLLNSNTNTSVSTADLRTKTRPLNSSTASLNSTSIVQQKLWSVVPLLNRKDGSSCSNLVHQRTCPPFPNSPGLRKCETVLALTEEPTKIRTSLAGKKSQSMYGRTLHSKSINNLMEPIKPLNRLRYSSSCFNNVNTSLQTCSRCSSLLSLSAAGSRYSLSANGAFYPIAGNGIHKTRDSCLEEKSDDDDVLADSLSKTNSSNNLILNDFNEIEPYDKNLENQQTKLLPPVQQPITTIEKFTCKLCLGEYHTNDKLTKISSCGCSFCTECMKAYVEFEISEGAYEVSCPDALCPSQGVISITEISVLAAPSLVTKHHRYRLNREVELDKYRTWCPKAGCETICLVGPSSSEKSLTLPQPSSSSSILQLPRAVHCPTCREDFCSGCKKSWHPLMTCEENTRLLAANGQSDSMMIFDNDLIKCCPMCAVPIEKDEGCAQMMCKRCKHVFCWYCLASLDDDFLLRHYDKGPCKNKLGHSRASVVWHRAQVIGIFAGFGILLLVASPLLLLAAPCIVCCKCRICSGAKLEEQETDYDELQH